MRYLGLDLGTKTLGIAITDRLGMIANPYKTIKFSNPIETIEPLKALIEEQGVGEIALGLPKNMDNSEGFASKRSFEYKELLESHIDIPITLVDERLSTMEAEKYLLSADVSRSKRKVVIDAVAASVILNTFIRMRGNEKDEREIKHI